MLGPAWKPSGSKSLRTNPRQGAEAKLRRDARWKADIKNLESIGQCVVAEDIKKWAAEAERIFAQWKRSK
jgi:hypothetical protein